MYHGPVTLAVAAHAVDSIVLASDSTTTTTLAQGGQVQTT